LNRRDSVTALFALCAALHTAQAQQPDHMRRVGVLIGLRQDDPESKTRIATIRKGLDELGWTDGRNVRIDFRFGGDLARIQAQAAEIVQSTPDVILVSGTQGLAELLRQTRSIPIVFAVVADPLGQGFVPSLSKPGGNVTGFSSTDDTTHGKLIELLKDLNPSITRVLVMADPNEPANARRFLAIQAAATALKVRLDRVDVRSDVEIERGIDAYAREANGGLLVLSSTYLTNRRDTIVAAAAKHRLPAIYPFRYFVTTGGLLSYGIDPTDLNRRATDYVDRILRGAKAGDLPIEQPTKFELVVNLKTAKALGISIPESILLRADEVIR